MSYLPFNIHRCVHFETKQNKNLAWLRKLLVDGIQYNIIDYIKYSLCDFKATTK